MLFAVGHLQLDGQKPDSIKASAIMSDCYEAFGAIIGVLAFGFIAFEVPERQLLHGAKSHRHLMIVLPAWILQALQTGQTKSGWTMPRL
ncbi:hypothetical protein Hsc_0833 [Herbaspirillum seropedicae]|nr:hypothetical protein Hsc_0833 [Herbaspirillum seropedicae]